jgi:hypothetical protein
MALKVTKAEFWVGDIPDRPGGLANVLKTLSDAGANLEGVIARRQPDKPGKGVVFLTPLKGGKVRTAGRSVKLKTVPTVAGLRVEGPDKPGTGERLTRALAEAGISLRGVSMMSLGSRFVAYFGFDSSDDASKAARILRR